MWTCSHTCVRDFSKKGCVQLMYVNVNLITYMQLQLFQFQKSEYVTFLKNGCMQLMYVNLLTCNPSQLDTSKRTRAIALHSSIFQLNPIKTWMCKPVTHTHTHIEVSYLNESIEVCSTKRFSLLEIFHLIFLKRRPKHSSNTNICRSFPQSIK